MTYETLKDIYDEDLKDIKQFVEGCTIFGTIIVATFWVFGNVMTRLFKFVISLVCCIVVIPFSILGFMFVKEFDFFRYCSLANFKYLMLNGQEAW